MSVLFAAILSFLAIFLILLVLVQRGRGGGLAGALGGMGGSSAFGAKAGDVFTRITIVTASVWIAFCLIAYYWSKHHGDALGKSSSAPTTSAPVNLPPAGSTAIPAGSTVTPDSSAAPPASTSAPPANQPSAPSGSTEPVSSTAPAPTGDGTNSEAPPAEKK